MARSLRGLSQRVHVGIRGLGFRGLGFRVQVMYIFGAQRGSHIPASRAKYIPYSYMESRGFVWSAKHTPNQQP